MTRLLCGDALTTLRGLAEHSVQCVVTSPPYFGLRDYQVEGQLGLEKTLEEYLARMVEVFREIKRVLRKDGTLWLNLGDSYAAGGGGGRGDSGDQGRFRGTKLERIPRATLDKFKPKDLVGVPWRIAFALQADGWYLRSDIIWVKPNPMPESVTDRPTKAHEYLFLLAKSSQYFFNHEAVREPAVGGIGDFVGGWGAGDEPRTAVAFMAAAGKQEKPENEERRQTLSRNAKERARQSNPLRNIRTVWTIPTQPFPEAHFATFPEKLVEPCIKAGTRIGDTVLDCFAGSGTAGVVAKRLRRDFIGIELKPEYCEMARKRIANEPEPML